MEVIVQQWTETEQGWGSRPDGISVHFSEEQRIAYIKEYQDNLNKFWKGKVPREYSYPDGGAIQMKIVQKEATEEILALVLRGTSFRYWKNSPTWLKRV